MPDRDLAERIRIIREHINKSPWFDSYTTNQDDWSKLCASLDAMGDTELAIKAYWETEFPASDGGKYLFVYGLLQSCYVQQDALTGLVESLGVPTGVPWKKYPDLGKIRDTRNDTVGHPTLRNTGSSHVISRITMGKDGFQYISYLKGGSFKIENVSTEGVIQDQLRVAAQVLDEVIGHLEAREKAHREKFMKDKLVDIFQHVDYPLQKMAEATSPGQILELGLVGFDEVMDVLRRFQEALTERGHTESAKRSLEELEHPLGKLGEFFNSVPNCIDHKTAYIFVDFVEGRFDGLKKWAQEIDEEYSA